MRNDLLKFRRKDLKIHDRNTGNKLVPVSYTHLVLEACRRTMDRLHKPNFDYADKILQSWSEKKVHTLADVERLDQEHQKKNSTRKKPSAARATGFTNFQQRDYDFDKLEEMLLQSQK